MAPPPIGDIDALADIYSPGNSVRDGVNTGYPLSFIIGPHIRFAYIPPAASSIVPYLTAHRPSILF